MKVLFMKIIYSSALLLLIMSIHFSAKSQSLLILQDTTSRGDNCVPPKITDACVTFIAKKSLELSFTSSVDRLVNVASKTEIGEYIEYNLTFPTDDLQYLDRVLSVHCQLFPQESRINLMLEPKESLRYFVTISECYNTYLKNGVNLFAQALYPEAKQEYSKAQECFDAPSDGEMVMRISVIDTILYLKKIAQENFEALDFKSAMETYNKIIALNPNDLSAKQKYNEAQSENLKLCDKNLKKAYRYYDEQNYEKAIALYNNILSNDCYDKNSEEYKLVEANLENIEKKANKHREIATAITYQMNLSRKGSPIKTFFGLSVGSYRDRKWAAYFTFLFNTEMFEAFRSNFPKPERTPEIDLAVGTTVRPVRNLYTPFWIAFGVGYTGVSDRTKLRVYSAVSPEVGILAKIPFGRDPKAGLVLRYTLQYRFALDPQMQNYFKRFNHIVGLGFCF